MKTLIRSLVLSLALGSAAAAQPISLHSDNPRYFLFQGKPTILITSGEHYGAVLNLDFDFVPYLDELKARGFNQTRVFSGTYREVPGSFNINANTLAPKPGRFCGPYARANTPGAKDGGNLFDLDRWNPDYFARLKRFATLAGERGIVVEFVLFCPFYEDSLWDVNAWNPKNNVNRTPAIPKTEVYTLKSPYLDRQLAFVRKVVEELNGFDNLYFEICNEPYFGGVTLDWQARIAATIVAVEKALPKQHLIAQNIANGKSKVTNPDPAVSLFNFHYARPPETVALNRDLKKAIGDDETGFQGVGDEAYRVEAWEFILAGGASFSNLDYSFTTDTEDGSAPVVAPTPGGGGPTYRNQLEYLARFVRGFDFIKMRPLGESPSSLRSPAGVVAHALVGSDGSVAAYLRKLPPNAVVEAEVPSGAYAVEWHDPVSASIYERSDVESKSGRLKLRVPSKARSSETALSIKPRRDL